MEYVLGYDDCPGSPGWYLGVAESGEGWSLAETRGWAIAPAWAEARELLRQGDLVEIRHGGGRLVVTVGDPSADEVVRDWALAGTPLWVPEEDYE